jgi:hypothetical protein
MTNVGYATLTFTPSPIGVGSTFSPALVVPGFAGFGAAGGTALGGGILGAASRALAPVAIATAIVSGAGAVIGWGRASISRLANLETINAQTAAVIRSTGGAAGVSAEHVAGLAERLEALTATRAESIQEGANLLLTFKNVRNDVGAGLPVFDRATASLVDIARAMGSDPSSVAIQLGKALNDPIAGVSALSRMGVQFTAGQEAVIASLVESGRMAEAQTIVLDEVAAQFGGSGEAYAGTHAGKVELLRAAWDTFGETVFGALMPALSAITSSLTVLLTTVLTPGVERVVGFVSDLDGLDLAEGLSEVVRAVGDWFATGLPDLIARAAAFRDDWLSNLADLLPRVLLVLVSAAPAILSATYLAFGSIPLAVLTIAPTLVETLASILPGFLSALLGGQVLMLQTGLTVLLGIVDAIVAVVPILVDTLVGILPALATLLVSMQLGIIEAATTLFLGLVQAQVVVMPQLVSTLLDALPLLVATLLAMLPDLVEGAVDLFFGLVTAQTQILPVLIATLLDDVLPTLISTLAEILPDLMVGSLQLWLGLVRSLVAMAGPVAGTIATEVVPALVDTLAGLASEWFQLGVDILAGLLVGLGRHVAEIAEFLLAPIRDAADQVAEILGIRSPSRTFEDLATEYVETLVDGPGRSVPAAPVNPTLKFQPRTAPQRVTDSGTTTGGSGLTADQEIHRAGRELKRALASL